MTSSMVERVVFAIRAERTRQALSGGYDRGLDDTASVRAIARAAIEAMREPSVPMVDSGVAFALCVSLSGDYRWSDYVTDKHRAMIDAALSEVESI
jgi:hypothetical protein